MGLEDTLPFNSVKLVHLLCAHQCSEGFPKSGDGQDMPPLMLCGVQQRSSIANIIMGFRNSFCTPTFSFIVFTVLLGMGRSGGGSGGVRWWCGGLVQRAPGGKSTESQLQLSKRNDGLRTWHSFSILASPIGLLTFTGFPVNMRLPVFSHAK